MKKYMILSIACLSIIAVAFIFGEVIKNRVPYVSVFSVSPIDVENTVICNGRIERVESTGVKAEYDCVISELYISKNARVNEGEALCKVKKLVVDNEDAESYYNMLKSTGIGVENLNNEHFESALIKSEYSGIVKNINYKIGDFIKSGSTIISFDTKDDLQVRLPVNENKISDIQVGQAVRITGSGFVGKEFMGTVRQIADEAAQTTTSLGRETTVDVVVSVDNATNDIKAGYTAKCEITVSIDKNRIVVPYDCIYSDEDGKEYVYVYSNKKAHKKYLTTGQEYDSGIEIIKGISTDTLIIASANKFEDNIPVVPVWGEVRHDR